MYATFNYYCNDSHCSYCFCNRDTRSDQLSYAPERLYYNSKKFSLQAIISRLNKLNLSKKLLIKFYGNIENAARMRLFNGKFYRFHKDCNLFFIGRREFLF